MVWDAAQDLRDAGGELPDAVVERLWNIIQALRPGSSGGRSGGSSLDDLKPHPRARPDAAIPGLALQNTREYAKLLDQDLVQQGRMAAVAGGDGTGTGGGGAAAADTANTRERSRSREPLRRRRCAAALLC